MSLDLTDKEEVAIEIKENGDVAFDGSTVYMNCAERRGVGKFFYRKDTIENLIICLKSFSEQPITFQFDSRIEIKYIIF